jgi:hypothetical protein
MTISRDDVIRMAREAGEAIETEWKMGGLSDGLYMDWAEAVALRVADAVAAAEREACAKVAFNAKTYIQAAAAIRARGQV